MRNKTKYILGYLIILFFLFLEYSWFENLPAGYVQVSLAMLLLLTGIKVFFERKRIRWFINNLSQKIRTTLAYNKLHTALFISILLLATALGIFAVMYVEGAMNADEAVEGVMAMHIYKGMSRPITIYKMPVDFVFKSYVAALFFNITGISAKPLQAMDLVFYLGILIFMYFLALEIFGKKAALITLFLLAIPPSSFYYVCLLRTGEYCGVLFFGIVVLFLTQRYVAAPGETSRETPKWFFCLIGFLWGIGFSIQALMMVFIVSSLIVLFSKDIKYFFKHILWRLIVFSLVGIFPLIIYNIRTNCATIKFFMNPPRAPLSLSVVEKIKAAAYNLSLAFGNVNAPSYGVEGLGFGGRFQLIVAIFFLGLCAISIFYFLWKRKLALSHWLLILVIIVTILLNLRPARSGPRPHYMIPLFASLPLFLAWWLSTFRWKLKCLILFLIFATNMSSIAGQLLYFRGKDIERMTLISKLNEMGVKYVGTGFWQAYPVTFITKEQIICSGRYGEWSRYARKGDPIKNVKYDPYDEKFHQALKDDPIKNVKYDPYDEKFHQALKDDPQSCAFMFEGSSRFERRFINSFETPLEKITVGRYKIYKLKTS